MLSLLKTDDLSESDRFAVINQLSQSMMEDNSVYYTDVILFLTEKVHEDIENPYNAYWLLLIAHAYIKQGAMPIAANYFIRILENYDDLVYKGNSIHLICLKNLIELEQTPELQIQYYMELINRFSDQIDIMSVHFKMGQLYEKLGEWELALQAYNRFLAEPKSMSLQVPGISDAYQYARKLIDFNNSPKDWTFETLEELEKAVKSAISSYDYHDLDSYRSKVNFFAMSWKQDAVDENSQANFTMRNFMTGYNRIRFDEDLDESSNPNEAYLRTWGWNQYVSIWYLYFRKISFPLDSDIHGRWEWAGIYFGEKL